MAVASHAEVPQGDGHRGIVQFQLRLVARTSAVLALLSLAAAIWNLVVRWDTLYFATSLGAAIGCIASGLLAKHGNLRYASNLLLLVAILALALGITYEPDTSTHHFLILGFIVPVMAAFLLDRMWVGAGLVAATLVFLVAHAAGFAHPPGEMATIAIIFVGGSLVSALDAVLRANQRRRAQVAETESDRLGILNEMQLALSSAAARRAREAESREQQAASDFKGIVERVPDGVLETTLGGDVLYLNPAGVAMFGYDSLEQLKAERPMIPAFYATPEERDRFIEQLKAGGVSEFRTRMLHRDGREIPVGLRAQLKESADGVHLLGVVRNREVEERGERLVAGLRKSERMMAEAEIVAGMGSWDFELETGKIRWSDGLCDLHGVPRGFEPQGLDGALRFYSPPDRQRIAAAVEQAAQRGIEYDFEVDARSDAGGPLRERVIGKPEVKEGRVVRLHGIVVDVTAAHKARLVEAALHEQEAQVQQISALSKLRAEFLNTAAHDLKTPLTPLRLQLATLKLGKDLNPKQLDSIGLMERNIGRFQILIDDMLDAARLQAGRLKLHRQTIVLAPLIREAADSFREAAEKNGLTFQLDIHADITIDGNPAKVMQVVMNLASNAVKYSPNGGMIEVTASNLESGVVLSFKDPGLGMSAEQLAHLFEPFVRLHEATPNVAKGTGLGMYISKGIVEQHGGQISATSPGPGKGTTFFVTWTKAQTGLPAGTPPPATAP